MFISKTKPNMILVPGIIFARNLGTVSDPWKEGTQGLIFSEKIEINGFKSFRD